MKIIALHGNPGTPGDWDVLARSLPQGFELTAVDSYSDAWVEEVQKSKEKCILIGHSWGCYRILSKLSILQGHVARILLVNPYVVPENPVSGLAQKIIQLPFLGDKILQLSHQKAVDSFFQNLIYPDSKTSQPKYAEIEKNLKKFSTWKQAALFKIKMQKAPLQDLSHLSVETVVIWGNEDRIGSQSVQIPFLQKNPNIKIKYIDNAGHNSIWSGVQNITEVLK